MKKLFTYLRLGPTNIVRVATYRLGLKSGWHPVQRLKAAVATAPFFREAERRGGLPPANTTWADTLWRFGWYREYLPNGTPDWFANPFSETPCSDKDSDWWRISDFGAGDIKGLWELSRFDWVIAWATQAAHGDTIALGRLNDWLQDWSQSNPPYKGPNWKCGQEASIRVLHLVVAAWVLGQDRRPEAGLIELLTAHLQRIASTTSYAIGQQNNHGTSEAAALFIGGSFLVDYDLRAKNWMCEGRRWLDERATTLIEPDGSFSQYSVTYHRLMLDTYAIAEAWRRHLNLPPFSEQLQTRLAAATDWLWALTDADSGDAPNIGANDGALLLPFTGADYRDFRPSVQLAAALFRDCSAFGTGPWSWPLHWLDVPEGSSQLAPQNVSFHDGGFHVLCAGRAKAVLRYPRFRFRPSQADALHLDFWNNGINLLRDAGTFSYNDDRSEWFSSTAAHNTIEFDQRDQMPRLSRFLFGDWLEAEAVELVHSEGASVKAAAAYTDGQGFRHHREITLSPNELTCRDSISGQFRTAHLRWRLPSCEWEQFGHTLRSSDCTIAIEINGSLVMPALETTLESRYYQHQSEISLLSVRVDRPSTLLTKVKF